MSVPRSILRGYSWDAASSSYRRLATGRYVARSEILDLLQSSLDQRERRVLQHGQRLAVGELGGRNYVELETLLYKRQALQQMAVAAGGWDRLNAADLARGQQTLTDCYLALGRQAQDVADGKASPAQIANRVHMTMGQIQRLGYETELLHRAVLPAGKVRIERRILDARAANCSDCLTFAAQGWQPEGELPRPGADSVCVTGDMLVEAQDIGRLYRREYDGDLVKITTAGGHQLTATPNHPIATPTGWVPIGAFNEGQQLLCGALAQGVTGSDPNIEYVPSPISELFDAAALSLDIERVAAGPMDFHGDGREQQVDIIRTDDCLARRAQTLCPKEIIRLLLTSPISTQMGSQTIATACFDCTHICGRESMSSTERDIMIGQEPLDGIHGCPMILGQRTESLPGLVGLDDGFGGQASEARGSAIGDDFPVLGKATNRQSCIHQASPNGMAANSECLGERQLGLARSITLQQISESGGGQDDSWRPFTFWLDRIVSVERQHFVGHVYNLTTGWHYYTAATIVTQNCDGNCRCSMDVREVPTVDAERLIGTGGTS